MSAAGGCLCGAVRYRVAGALSAATACHCSQCRRASGHVLAFVGARRDEVAVEGAVAWFESTPGVIRRGFCPRPRCGSQLFWDRIGGAQLDLSAGTLDAPTGVRLEKHIFVADKGDYYAIGDGLPQFAGRSGGAAGSAPGGAA